MSVEKDQILREIVAQIVGITTTFYDMSKLACAYRWRWSDMTPNDLEPIIYYIVVKFPTITIPPPVNLFHSNLSKPILCRNATLMTDPELQKFGFHIIFFKPSPIRHLMEDLIQINMRSG